ncbi:MAG: methyltransferase domain-containing protein [Hyphomicrobiaceae bacterium]|nr:methyltransferase domain-containing protein [Hyphomicrobiaceae bacterium]
MTNEPFDRVLIRNRRSRHAPRIDAHDFLLARVAADFAERLAIIQRTFAVGVSIGAAHGLLSRSLRELPNIGLLIDAEAALELLARCEHPRVQADEEWLPFADEALDLVVSGLSLHLVNDLPGTLVQIRRALKPDGLVLAAMIGGASLAALRQAWLVAEDDITGGASPRVAPFVDVRDLGTLAQRAGLALPVVDRDVVEVTYASPLSLMAELQAMAGANPLSGRRRVPVTRRLLLRAAEVYAELCGGPDGRVTATFEILTLTAWAPAASQPQPLKPGSAEVRLADALGVRERKL